MTQLVFTKKFKEFKAVFIEILRIKVLIKCLKTLISLISHNLWITLKVNQQSSISENFILKY